MLPLLALCSWRSSASPSRTLSLRRKAWTDSHSTQKVRAPSSDGAFLSPDMKRVLITGGTGSFGRAFLKRIVSCHPEVERLVVFSRDELKQWEIQQDFPTDVYPFLRFFLGDVRDQERLKRALRGIDTVVHAAALKQVPAAEYNPIEFINTNVLGAENVVQACLDTDVQTVVALSTDKAAAPINLYGATKLCSDKLFVAANNVRGRQRLRFSVVRYGNVMGSRGSVIPFFIERSKTGTIPITNPHMTRFNITTEEGVDMVLWTIQNGLGGEILIPKIPSYRITDLAEAIGPNCEKKIIGIRPGEKIHEEMITSADSNSTLDLGTYYGIIQPISGIETRYKERFPHARAVEPGFSYNSETNPNFMTVSQLRQAIKDNVNRDFKPA